MRILTTLLMMGEGGKPNPTMNIIFILVLFVICYFIIISPQLKRNRLSNTRQSPHHSLSINEQKVINVGRLLKRIFYSLIGSIAQSLILGVICYFNTESSQICLVIFFFVGFFNMVYILTCIYSIAFQLEHFTHEVTKNNE